ncbi:hypothetical protein ONE63_006273 [Megalurothrips usitatus]|uniref:Mitochondrial transcription rescue factor 1 C-terminal domain-containing protein n=1 Tax=Megalurothrips usitatus TaxID=439358 RepID=A0AAV7XZT4_9NEOP|nr:hypothetical protein ONE63_006273 [Megalurothrips usitatus]
MFDYENFVAAISNRNITKNWWVLYFDQNNMISRILFGRNVRQVSGVIFQRNSTLVPVRMMSAMPVSRDIRDVLMPKQMTPNLLACRYKSKKKANKGREADDEVEKEEEEEEGEDEDGDSEVAPGEKILKLSQLRSDKLLKSALSSTRLVDSALLEGRLYRNDTKLLKKATPIVAGDVLDLELGPDPKNKDLIKVHRVEVVEVKEGSSHSQVRVAISKNVSIKPPS